MPAPLRQRLTDEEERTLKELRVASQVPHRVRDRAHMVLLNARGWNAPELAEIFDCQEDTVRRTLKRWQTQGLGGLWEAKGRGRKRTYSEADWSCVEQWLKVDERTYNSAQLSQKLAKERHVKLSKGHIQKLLKKRGTGGNAHG